MNNKWPVRDNEHWYNLMVNELLPNVVNVTFAQDVTSMFLIWRRDHIEYDILMRPPFNGLRTYTTSRHTFI